GIRDFHVTGVQTCALPILVFPSVGMPNVLWQLQGPRSLEHVIVHEAEKEDGSMQWERVSAKYDGQGFSEITTEALENFSGAASKIGRASCRERGESEVRAG